MTDLQIPPHIDMTRRIAVDLAVTVATLGDTEQQLRGQLDEHQRDAAAERDRIEAELVAARERAEKHLSALAETERRLTGELIDVGRRLQQHRDEAEQAQQSVADWCTRRAIDPADLPPLTGPIPAIPAAPLQQVPYAEHVGRRVEVLAVGDEESVTGQLIRVDQAGVHVLLPEGEQTIPVEHVAALRPAVGELGIPAEPKALPSAVSVADVAAGVATVNGQPVAAHGPGMTLPDTGLNPAPLPPAGGPQPHRKPGLIDRITGRTGPQPVQGNGVPAEVPSTEQDGGAL